MKSNVVWRKNVCRRCGYGGKNVCNVKLEGFATPSDVGRFVVGVGMKECSARSEGMD